MLNWELNQVVLNTFENGAGTPVADAIAFIRIVSSPDWVTLALRRIAFKGWGDTKQNEADTMIAARRIWSKLRVQVCFCIEGSQALRPEMRSGRNKFFIAKSHCSSRSRKKCSVLMAWIAFTSSTL